MIKKIKDIIIIIFLLITLFIEAKMIKFLFYLKFEAKEISTADLWRENISIPLDSTELKYFRNSPLYKKYMNSSRRDSISYYFNNIDSEYRAKRK